MTSVCNNYNMAKLITFGEISQRNEGNKFGGKIPKFYLRIYLKGVGVAGGKLPLNCFKLIFF